jgi:histidinol-phosphate aminotransferase
VYDVLLRAFKEWNAPQTHLVLVGGRDFEVQELKAMARELEITARVQFAGRQTARPERREGSNVKAICLASPNNPDGSLLPRADLLRLLQVPALVMLDEAYFEFAGTSAVDLIPEYPNLAIVRTFSKWAGMAGLRVGYIIASPEFANALHKLRAPYNVNWAGLVAARESLNDADYLLNHVRATVAERERMRVELANLGWLAPLPSYTNFLLLRVHKHEPQQVKQFLAQQGILIRAFKSQRLREYIRLSIGTPEMNDAVLNALRQF